MPADTSSKNQHTARRKHMNNGIDQFIDSIAIPAFVIDKEHVITHWNKALTKASGLSSESMVGTQHQWRPFYSQPRPTMADLIIEGDIDSGIDKFYNKKYKPSELLDGAYVAEDFFPEVGQDGEWLSFTASPIRNDDGCLIGAIETLTIITDRKKAELELIESEQKFRVLSTTDGLTQLYNSRFFFQELATELDRARRYSHPLSLAMLDLDHFKQLNDSYGHIFGDRVLETVGSLIKTHLRSVDSAYRYGGEEFSVIMPDADEENAVSAVERIRCELQNTRFESDEGGEVKVTMSIGVTSARKGDDVKAILKRADVAMYKAKRSGRNTTVASFRQMDGIK